MKKSLREWAVDWSVDLFLMTVPFTIILLFVYGLSTFKLGTKSEDDLFHNEVFVCRLGKEVTTLTATQSVTTKDGVVWYVVDGKGQKHIYVKSQFESCFTISQDALGYSINIIHYTSSNSF